MDTDPAVPAETPDHGYAVTLVARTSNDHHLQPPLDLPEGITAAIEGPEIVLTVPVRAPNASSALAAAKATATDLLMVLASTFNGYEFVVDDRQVTSRTDAVYQADGSVPPSTSPRAVSPRPALPSSIPPANDAGPVRC